MKKHLTRFLAALLAVLLLFGAAPLAALAAGEDISGDFTDENFLFAIRWALGQWGSITAEDCEKITTLFVDNAGIESLAGIEHLTNLSVFDCSGNELTALDFSQNPNLTRLGCGENPLVSLNVRDNPELWQLNCPDTFLTTLDVSKNSEMKILFIPGNHLLGSLDVTNNPLLTELNVAACGLATLDLTQNTQLESLFCQYNSLTSLKLTGLEALVALECSDNQLTSLDLTDCPFLIQFSCENNKLTSLNISKNPALMWLTCGENEISSLDLLGNQILMDLRCGNNVLTQLDLSENTLLQYLDCAENRLTSLDVKINEALVYLDCSNNAISTIDLSANKDLNEANLAGNNLSVLDIRGLTRLRSLDMSKNKIPSLQAIIGLEDANLRKLVYDPPEPGDTDNTKPPQEPNADVSGNITDPDFLAALRKALGKGANTSISTLELQSILALDLSNQGIKSVAGLEYLTGLKTLNLSGNLLEQLDLSANTALTWLDVSNNHLQTLDLTPNRQLQYVNATLNFMEDQSALRFASPAPQNVMFSPQNSYVVTQPTCTASGCVAWTCNHIPPHILQVNEVHPLGHDYQKTVIYPTLTSEGYTQYTCSRCGDSYIEDTTPYVSGKLALRYRENTTWFSDIDQATPELT